MDAPISKAMQTVRIPSGGRSYRLFGECAQPCVVIESALASSCAEWWHLAQRWSDRFCVLTYDRGGYGESDAPDTPRTPDTIASEFNDLLDALGIRQVTLIGHSIGGLYAYRFSQLFPQKVSRLILVDPVSPDNRNLKDALTPKEFKQSGIDKSFNLKLGFFLCSLGLGGFLKPLLKKSPPFHYYREFSNDAETALLKNATSKKTYRTAIEEYSRIEDDGAMDRIRKSREMINVPFFLICHSPEIMRKEIVYYGGAEPATAEKIERAWSGLMRGYLKCARNGHFIQARRSGHHIHLTDPDSIHQALIMSAQEKTQGWNDRISSDDVH